MKRVVYSVLMFAILAAGCSTAPAATPPDDDSAQAEPTLRVPGMADGNWKDGERIEVDYRTSVRRGDTRPIHTRCTFGFDIFVKDDSVVFSPDLLPLPLEHTTDHYEFDLLYRRLRCAVPAFEVSLDGRLLSTDAASLAAAIIPAVQTYYRAHPRRFEPGLADQVSMMFSEHMLESKAEWWWEILTGLLGELMSDTGELTQVPCEDSEDSSDCLTFTFTHVEDRSLELQQVMASHERVERAQSTHEYELHFRTGTLPPHRILRSSSSFIHVVDERTGTPTFATGEEIDDISLQRVR